MPDRRLLERSKLERAIPELNVGSELLPNISRLLVSLE